MAESLEDKIHGCKSLPSLPATAINVLKISGDDATGLDELARTIAMDAGLCSKLLVAVNSSFYGLSNHVSSITQAVTLLGMQAVKTLVLGFSLVNNYKAQPGKGFNHLGYWRRSMYSAAAAREIACAVRPGQVEECFIAALLMDLGTLALDQVLGEEYGAIHEKAGSHANLRMMETHALGMDHAAVGGILAADWRLPEVLRVPIGAHHAPERVEDPALQQVTAIISLAGLIADMFMEPMPEMIASVRRAFRDSYAIGAAECDKILCEIARKTAELAPLFDIRLNATINFEELLAKASDQLATLSNREAAAERVNRRLAARIEKNGSIDLIPSRCGIIGRPIRVNIRDVSASGLGIFYNQPMAVGDQFVIRVPLGKGKGSKSLLYTVQRCSAYGAIYGIGLSLTSVSHSNFSPIKRSGQSRNDSIRSA